jgi:orotate phosphoribosyltransferase-like protein
VSTPETALLLPSGAITPRRVTWSAIATGLRASNVAYVLARALEARLPDLRGVHPTIAYWSPVPASVAEGLQSSLATPVRPVQLHPDAVAFRRGDFSPIYPGQEVILLVDALLSGRTASALVSALRRMDTRPIAVAALLDGRLDCGSPVQTFAASVPVVACLQRTAVLSTRPDRLSPVGSDGRSETPRAAIRSQYKVQAQTFADWLRDADEPELLVGHIDRGSQRHFTTYLNVPHLLERHLPELRDAALALIAEAAPMLVPFSSDRRVKIFVPNSFAESLGVVLSEGLRELYHCDVKMVEATKTSSGKWTAATAQLEPDFLAIVLDWGAVTATTVRGLATHVAEMGAAAVQVIAVTSQLDATSEEGVCTTAALRVSSPRSPEDLFDAQDAQDHRDVPTRFDFLTSARMGLAPASECQMCEVARVVRVHTSGAPTRLLRTHASAKYDIFRPTTREEAFASIKTDLVGGELSAGDAYEIWLLRQRLENCRDSTQARDDLTTRLLSSSVFDQPGQWSGLIRLLIVEPSWLKLAPLDRRSVRKHIADQAAEILNSANALAMEFTSGLRWQAAMVLRSASKSRFLELFPIHLVRSVATDLRVAAELCYGMFTLIDAPYHHESRTMTNVIAAIREAMDLLRTRLAGDQSIASIYRTLRSLYGTAVAIQAGLRAGGDVLSTWHVLRAQYAEPLRTHTGVLTSMLIVQGGLSGRALARRAQEGDLPDGQYWRRRALAWEECRAFLDANVFPYLARLRDQLRQSIDIPESGLGTLFALDSSRAASFAEEIQSLVEQPHTFDTATQARLAQEASVWFGELLSGPQGQDGSGATLFRLLQDIPATLDDAWETALRRSQEAGRRIRSVEGTLEPLVVFVERGLLIDVLVQIVENASIAKHATTDRPSAGVSLGIEAFRDTDSSIVIRVLNDTSQPTQEVGEGIAAYQERVQAYGASLSHGPVDADGDWTWQATLRVQAWEGL